MNKGGSPTIIARIVGACRTSLYRWKKLAHPQPEGLVAKSHSGPEARLTAEQLS